MHLNPLWRAIEMKYYRDWKGTDWAWDSPLQLMSKYILVHTAHTGACALGAHFSASGFVFCDRRTQLDPSVSLRRAHAPICVKARTGRMSAVWANAWTSMYFDKSCSLNLEGWVPVCTGGPFWNYWHPSWRFGLWTKQKLLLNKVKREYWNDRKREK